MSKLSLLNSLNLASLAYEAPEAVAREFPCAFCFDSSHAGDEDTQFFACALNNELTIAFRGSSSLSDFLVDADFKQDAAPPELIEGALGVRVHGGFLRQFMAAVPKLLDILKTHEPALPIHVVGHSLGGALATLCALSLKAGALKGSGCRKVACTTFGSPRVGNAAFSKAFDSHVRSSVRVVNSCDAVTMRPYWGYSHVGGELVFRKEASFLARWLGSVADHKLDSYKRSLSA